MNSENGKQETRNVETKIRLKRNEWILKVDELRENYPSRMCTSAVHRRALFANLFFTGSTNIDPEAKAIEEEEETLL